MDQPIEETKLTLTRHEVRLLLNAISYYGDGADGDGGVLAVIDDLSVKLNRAVFKTVFPRKDGP